MTTRTNKTTKREAKSGAKSTRSRAKRDEAKTKASANTCEDTSAASESDCGCGPAVVRVWSTGYGCCGEPQIVARSYWDDCCCSC